MSACFSSQSSAACCEVDHANEDPVVELLVGL